MSELIDRIKSDDCKKVFVETFPNNMETAVLLEDIIEIIEKYEKEKGDDSR